MKRKKRYIARMDEVTITKEQNSAVIAYKEEGVPTTHLTIGPEIAAMTDGEILELFNDTLRAQAQLAAEYKHVAVEVPLGSPQIKYHPRAPQWTARGGVLRCLIDFDEHGMAVVQIAHPVGTMPGFSSRPDANASPPPNRSARRTSHRPFPRIARLAHGLLSVAG